MSIIDNIFTILKEANPDASDADIHAQATQLSQHPDAASVMNSIAPAAPTTPSQDITMDKNPIGMPSAPPMPASSFDVPVSDNTVTQNGSPQSVGIPATNNASGSSIQTPPSPVSPEAPSNTPVVLPTTKPSNSIAPSTPLNVSKPPVPSLPADSKDQATRDAGMAEALKGRKIANIVGLGAGASDAINNGLHAFGISAPTDQQDKLMERAKANFEESKGLLEEKISNDPNSEASKTARSLVLQIAPQMADDPNFNSMSDKMLRDKLPLVDTMMKAKAAEDSKKMSLAQIKANKDISLGLKESQQQDRLEAQARQAVTNLRGDKSLARTEEQRDGAISAYQLIDHVKSQNRMPSQVEYYDLLGQMWKARNGSSLTQGEIKDLDAKTFQGSLSKAAQYFTGKPAGVTTGAILNNIQDFIKDSGQTADKLHDGYMKAHLIKPSGLEDARWQPIRDTGRGISFADATKLHDAAAKSAINQDNDPMGLR